MGRNSRWRGHREVLRYLHLHLLKAFDCHVRRHATITSHHLSQRRLRKTRDRNGRLLLLLWRRWQWDLHRNLLLLLGC